MAGKIRDQRTLLQRNHVEPNRATLAGLKDMADRAEQAGLIEELLGLEGNGARLYLRDFGGMIKPGEGQQAVDLPFDFEGRNRRPPRDHVNALLSPGCSLLAKDLSYAVGLDPYIGFFHQPRFRRPALALDLMEPIPAVDRGLGRAERDQHRHADVAGLRARGRFGGVDIRRKAFFRAYELRMDTSVTHPLSDYRVSYRRLLEIQPRLLTRVLEGEIAEFPRPHVRGPIEPQTPPPCHHMDLNVLRHQVDVPKPWASEKKRG